MTILLTLAAVNENEGLPLVACLGVITYAIVRSARRWVTAGMAALGFAAGLGVGILFLPYSPAAAGSISGVLAMLGAAGLALIHSRRTLQHPVK